MKIIDKETKKSDFYGIPIQTERRNDLTIDILSAYYSEHHHCNVSARTSFDGIALGKRVKSLIADFDLIEALNICINLQSISDTDEPPQMFYLDIFNINLTMNQYNRLKDLGFNQQSTSCLWEMGYHYLKKYFKHYGHSYVKSTDKVNEKGVIEKDDSVFHLGAWCAKQRIAYITVDELPENTDDQHINNFGKLTYDQVNKLDKLQFIWKLDIDSLLKDPRSLYNLHKMTSKLLDIPFIFNSETSIDNQKSDDDIEHYENKNPVINSQTYYNHHLLKEILIQENRYGKYRDELDKLDKIKKLTEDTSCDVSVKLNQIQVDKKNTILHLIQNSISEHKDVIDKLDIYLVNLRLKHAYPEKYKHINLKEYEV